MRTPSETLKADDENEEHLLLFLDFEGIVLLSRHWLVLPCILGGWVGVAVTHLEHSRRRQCFIIIVGSVNRNSGCPKYCLPASHLEAGGSLVSDKLSHLILTALWL